MTWGILRGIVSCVWERVSGDTMRKKITYVASGQPILGEAICRLYVRLFVQSRKKRKNGRSRDADELQIAPVKYVLVFISPWLTHIFNLSF